MLKDIVLDVAKNIAGLGMFEEILVEQETDSTKFTAYPEGNMLTVLANSKDKVVELPDAFGMLNLGFYVGLTNLYRNEDSAVATGTNANSEIDRLTFSSKDGNKDEYRLTPTNIYYHPKSQAQKLYNRKDTYRYQTFRHEQLQ